MTQQDEANIMESSWLDTYRSTTLLQSLNNILTRFELPALDALPLGVRGEHVAYAAADVYVRHVGPDLMVEHANEHPALDSLRHEAQQLRALPPIRHETINQASRAARRAQCAVDLVLWDSLDYVSWRAKWPLPTPAATELLDTAQRALHASQRARVATALARDILRNAAYTYWTEHADHHAHACAQLLLTATPTPGTYREVLAASLQRAYEEAARIPEEIVID